MSLIFKGKKEADKQKLRGGYYTPITLSNFLCEWAISVNTNSILEPSCGDGNFIVSAVNAANAINNESLKITAVEIDKDEIKKAKIRLKETISDIKVKWVNDDFFQSFSVLKKKKFDCVIGNPPFIRFQYFDDLSRETAFRHLNDAGYKPNKLANSWSAFIQLSIELLEENGRMAMVVPAEVLQVKYAAELRERITQSFEKITLVTFKKLVFKDIQQEVVLLLAEGKKSQNYKKSDVQTIEIKDESQLNVYIFDGLVSHSNVKHAREGMKWTSFFLSDEQFKAVDAAQKNKKLSKLGNFVSVDVGIVTGRNSFFVLTNQIKEQYKLGKYTVPLVGKTNALKSLSFSKNDFEKFKEINPAFLLKLNGVNEKEFSKDLIEYIEIGERQGVHKGYKCRIRRRWYEVPSTHLSDGFLFRQIHKYPLLVANEANATCTDTIHRVRLIDKDISFNFLSMIFINSLTFTWAELCGRSYGGGVLEIEPNEAEEIPIPYLKNIDLDFDFIDDCIKSGEIEKALDYNDRKLLIEGLGLSKRRVDFLRDAWIRLRDRRIFRK